MEFLTGVMERDVWETVKINGMVHSVRDMGNIVFLVLRKRDGLLQCVCEGETADRFARGLREETAVEAEGVLTENAKAPGGMELRLTGLRILSAPARPLPVQISRRRLPTSLETSLDMRPVTLRNLRERARFRIQEGVVRGFREFLQTQGFTEIHTPKLGSKGAEGGANIFKLEYFHRPAVLAQSPQLYKQMMVGVFDRVFEVGPVFRAEKHNTRRHLNEYTSMDFEMGFIEGFEEIMAMETGVLQRIMEVLRQDYPEELALLEVTLPDTERIPCVRFDEAKRLAAEKYGRPIRSPFDLEPEEELLIGRYFQEEYGADFVFVTHYPGKKRPFYAMDDPRDDKVTLSFDCLLRGMEITTGGQRIHDYGQLLKKLEGRGMTTEGLEHYLSAFAYGLPPHGGLGIGLERLTMKILGEDNVRQASLFPRDLSRLEP